MNVLALDIGGTNTRIALVSVDDKPIIKKKKTILTEKIEDVSDFINTFNKKAEHACIGFAGPITGSKAVLTNAHLKIDVKKIKKKTNLKEVSLLNDFHAAGHGVSFLDKKDMLVLNKGKPKNKTKMVTGPGTGLGKAYVVDGHVIPSEPGYTTLGIENIQDYALLDYLKSKFKGPVYYEDVLSGRGLIDIYDHLEIKSNLETNMKIRKLIKEEPIHKAKLITKYSDEDKLCDMTLRIFTKFYARFVRDSVLNVISSEAYLVGGISEAIQSYLDEFFMDEFLRHRKYTKLLKDVRVSVVLNEDVGLLGAGAVAGALVH